MSDCCTPAGYRQLFSESSARAQAKRYRRQGLDATSQRILELVRGRGIEGKTVLEVGGGIGALQLELLKEGAAGATSVELTPTYEEVALDLAREAGLADRVRREVLDFTTAGPELGPADLVILNRVLCCYPDMPKLAGAAAARTAGTLVLSFPKQRWWTHLVVGAANAGLLIARRQFHIFLHPPRRILATAQEAGLRALADDPGLFWEVAAFERDAA